MVFDTAIKKLKERISDKASPVNHAIEQLVVAGWKGEDVPEEQLYRVTTFYGNDLERDRLRAQIVTLENIHEHDKKEDVAIKEIINHLSVSGLRRIVTHAVKLLQLYLVCPSSMATAERSFSQLRRIKSYLRTTL